MSNEDGQCLECSGTMVMKPVEDCACHVAPPCSACTSATPVCNACGWASKPLPLELLGAQPLPFYHPVRMPISLSGGGRLLDVDYDSSSGSTMVYTGQIEGAATAQEIIAALGDGSFGHRGPVIRDGRFFTYTKITD